MFPGGFFAKSYFAGTYFPPIDGGATIEDVFSYRPLFRPRRR